MTKTSHRDAEATRRKLVEAVAALITSEGFGSIGINALARRAGVDKVLIYRYFSGLPGLLAVFAEEGDFWWQVEDILAAPLPGPDDDGGLAACLSLVFTRHAAFLRSHPVTLEVIAWEMAERNELTAALESVRESRSIAMMRRLAARFRYDESAFLERVGPMLALLGAAANYLAARGRRLHVFNGIDLRSDKGWQTLTDSAATMIASANDTVFADLPKT